MPELQVAQASRARLSNLRYPTNHVQLVADHRRLPHHVSPARPIARGSQLALELRSGRLRPARPRLYRLPRHPPRRSHRPVAASHRPTRAPRKSLFPHPPRQRSSCSSGEYRSLLRARTLMDPARVRRSRRDAAVLARLHSRTRIALRQHRELPPLPELPNSSAPTPATTGGCDLSLGCISCAPL